MKIQLSEIKDTEPIRKHGDIKSLAESIKTSGLLQPIVINQNNELICGRRRFEACRILGWKDIPVYRINTDGDIDKLSKSIVENIMRLNLSWQEEVRAKEELDQMMRVKHGSAKPGGDRQTEEGKKHWSDSDQWSINKTADLLNQSKALMVEDLQLAQALKEDPELEKIKRKSFAKREFKRIKDDEKIKYAKEHAEEIAKEHPEGEVRYWKSRDGFKVKEILEGYMNGLPLIRYECDDPGYKKIVEYKNSDVYKISLEFISYLESTAKNLKKIYKKYEDTICDDGKKNLYPEMENALKSLKVILNQIMESKETKKILEYESKEVIRTGWTFWGSEIEW